jgi:hypothetical protein
MSGVLTAMLVTLLAAQSEPTVVIKLGEASERCPTDGDSGVGRGAAIGRSHGGQAPSPRLKVSLQVMDGGSYRVGERISFRVVLTNIDAAPVAVPILARNQICAEVRDSVDQPRRATIELRARADGRRAALISIATLWGVASRPESLRMVRPGESIGLDVVRVWQPLDAPSGIADPARLYVRAEGFGAQPVESNEVLVRAAP